MIPRWFQVPVAATILMVVPEIALAQAPRPSGTLVVDGYSGQIPVVQVNGKSYIEVDALARLANGSVGYPGNQMTLSLPAPNAPVVTEKKGFSPDFLRAGIEAMGAIREWRAALQHVVQNNYPMGNDWLGNFQHAAEERRALTGVAATTDDDRNGLVLLDMELAMMQRLSDNYKALYKSSTYVTADAFDRDPLNKQVIDCARGLGSMAGGGQYQDVSVCH